MTTRGGEPVGFFRALFDLSFSHYVTIRVARIAFVLAIMLAAAILLGGLFAGVSMVGSADSGIGPESSLWRLKAAEDTRQSGWTMIILSPFVSVGIVIVSRIAVEMTVVVFSIAESLTDRR